MEAVVSILRREDQAERLLISACQVAVVAVEYNQKLDELVRGMSSQAAGDERTERVRGPSNNPKLA
jgi:hypothetical protein